MSAKKNKQVLKYVSVVLIAIVIVSVAVTLLVFNPTSESAPQEDYITVVDMVERSVNVSRNVQKVVTTVPDTLRLVVMLGAVDKVVGVTSYVDMGYAEKMEDVLAYPQLLDSEVGRVGASSEVDAEKIAEMQPDVVFLYAPYSNLVSSIEEKANVPVVCVSAGSTPEEFYSALRLVGKILDKETKAEEIITYYQNQIDSVQSRVADVPSSERSTVYLADWAYKYGVGWTSSAFWPVEAAGGVNVAQNLSASYMEVSEEQILEWNPDVIFIHGYKGESAVDEILADPLLQGIQTVKDGEVYGVFGPYIGHGPKMWLVDMYMIGKTLYPDKFSDVDVLATGAEIFQFFYGDAGSGVFDTVIANRGVYLSPDLTP